MPCRDIASGRTGQRGDAGVMKNSTVDPARVESLVGVDQGLAPKDHVDPVPASVARSPEGYEDAEGMLTRPRRAPTTGSYDKENRPLVRSRFAHVLNPTLGINTLDDIAARSRAVNTPAQGRVDQTTWSSSQDAARRCHVDLQSRKIEPGGQSVKRLESDLVRWMGRGPRRGRAAGRAIGRGLPVALCCGRRRPPPAGCGGPVIRGHCGRGS